MRRYLNLKCHEVVTDSLQWVFCADRRQELSTYLRRILHVWSKITSSNTRLMNLVDVGTVKYLESRAPAASEQDTHFIKTCMDTGKFFAQVLDPAVRKTIVNSICAIERLVPSLWTFFEDLKQLGPCSKPIKTLLELHGNYTIYEALSMIFVHSDDNRHSNHFESSYRQLWIFAICHLPDLLTVCNGNEPLKGVTCVKQPISIIRYRYARRTQIGFSIS